jgi:hypothetical protein
MSNINKINGLDIDAASAQYVAAGNVDGPLGSNSVELSVTASYISPTFISASAAASGFGSGGGGGPESDPVFTAWSGSTTSRFAGTASFAATASYSTTLGAEIINPESGMLRLRNSNSNTISIITGLTASLSTTALTASSVGTLNQNVTINGNLSVFGTASYTNVSSSELNIGTSLITVNTSNPTNRFGGLAVIDSGSSPRTSGSILFDSVNDQWVFIHNTAAITSSIFIQSPQTYNDLGNEINLTTNRVPKSTNAEHIGDSNISDTGTVVSINSATQITGSLTVTGNVIATASWASNAVTASYIDPTFISASAAASGFGTGGGGGGVTSITAGSGISVNQSTGNVTITNTGGGGGGTNLGLVYAVSIGYLMP